jgi:hypothetical protein
MYHNIETLSRVVDVSCDHDASFPSKVKIDSKIFCVQATTNLLLAVQTRVAHQLFSAIAPYQPETQLAEDESGVYLLKEEVAGARPFRFHPSALITEDYQGLGLAVFTNLYLDGSFCAANYYINDAGRVYLHHDHFFQNLRSYSFFSPSAEASTGETILDTVFEWLAKQQESPYQARLAAEIHQALFLICVLPDEFLRALMTKSIHALAQPNSYTLFLTQRRKTLKEQARSKEAFINYLKENEPLLASLTEQFAKNLCALRRNGNGDLIIPEDKHIDLISNVLISADAFYMQLTATLAAHSDDDGLSGIMDELDELFQETRIVAPASRGAHLPPIMGIISCSPELGGEDEPARPAAPPSTPIPSYIPARLKGGIAFPPLAKQRIKPTASEPASGPTRDYRPPRPQLAHQASLFPAIATRPTTVESGPGMPSSRRPLQRNQTNQALSNLSFV